MSHLHVHLELDTIANFDVTFDIFEIIFWAIICCLVTLKNWQICGLGITYPLMIDISFKAPKTFLISIILKVSMSEYLNALGMNQWARSETAILCILHFHHNIFSIHVFGCYLCWTAHIEKNKDVTSVSKKSGQTTAVIQYYSLSRFFWNRHYLQHEKMSLCCSLGSLFHISSCFCGVKSL